MANTTIPQKQPQRPTQKTILKNEQKRSRYVRQDGSAPGYSDAASSYAERAGEVARSRHSHTKNDRVKKRSTSRRTVQIIAWAPRPISAQVDQTAVELHKTRSKAALYLIELGLANNILREHIKVIIETIGEATTKANRKSQKPYRDNSYRSAFYSVQNRTLLTNILRLLTKLLDEPPNTLLGIIRKSEEEARDALTLLSPQIADLIRKQEHEQSEEEEREE
jgi:hypothetical protein